MKLMNRGKAAFSGRRRRTRWAMRWLQVLLVVLAVGMLLGAAAFAVVWFRLPDVEVLSEQNPGRTAYQVYFSPEISGSDEVAEPSWTAQPELPPLLFLALVHAEDNRFHQHHGVDWRTTRRAARRWLQGRAKGGGSTITQQLARNLYLSPSRTPSRKLAEILIALRMERAVSKERVLELYANVIEYGEGVWGITDAAEYYFDAEPEELTPFEIIFLCSLLPAPRADLQGANLERAFDVQRRVSENLFLEEAISAATYEQIRFRQSGLREELEAGIPVVEALSTTAPLEAGRGRDPGFRFIEILRECLEFASPYLLRVQPSAIR